MKGEFPPSLHSEPCIPSSPGKWSISFIINENNILISLCLSSGSYYQKGSTSRQGRKGLVYSQNSNIMFVT